MPTGFCPILDLQLSLTSCASQCLQWVLRSLELCSAAVTGSSFHSLAGIFLHRFLSSGLEKAMQTVCWHPREWGHKARVITCTLPSRPAGVDVWGPHGGHPLLQGGPHL